MNGRYWSDGLVGAGIPREEAYVDLTEYKVKTTLFEISCDSVLMTYPNMPIMHFQEFLRIG